MNDNLKLTCIICNKFYVNECTLKNHNIKYHNNQLKNIKYDCNYCEKKFNNRQNKWSHQKICKLKNIYVNKKITKKYNIVINDYKNDNIEYVSEKFKDNLFKQLKKKENHVRPIPYLIENIKFNPVHKENHNVKIKSDRSKIGFIYDEHKWCAINKNQLLDDLMKYGFKIFKQYFNERKDNLSNDIIDNYDDFEETYKTNLKHAIKEKIENIAYIFTLNNNDELPLDF